MTLLNKTNRFFIDFHRAVDLIRMARDERKNYLRQCWTNGHRQEGMQASIYPFRYLIYRWCRDLVSPKELVKYSLLLQAQEEISLMEGIPDLFVNTLGCPAEFPEKDALFSDIEQQMVGVFRLAGGAYLAVGRSLNGIQDIEHLHAYHRLYWAVRYARAVFCGHSGALQALKRDLSAWMLQAWEGDVAVAAPYTVSERIASLAEVLFWLKHAGISGLAELVGPIKRCIYLDAIHLQENLEVREDFNNHILNNARALYISSLILGDALHAKVWEDLAFGLWEKYFPELVLEDGTFAEQTSFYHLQMCRTALEYILATRQSGRGIVPELLQRIQKMFLQADDLLRPDGSLIRSGNSSPDHVVDDFWGLLSAVYVHGLLPHPPRHKVVTLLTLYYSGVSSLPVNESQLSLTVRSAKKTVLYPQGGWMFMTDPELGMEMTAHGDPRAQTYCSGDSGRGTFELWWKNMVLIREPGNPTYTLSARYWYRNGTGQNVSSLNGVPPGISSEYQSYLPSWYFACQNGEWERFGEEGARYVSYGLERLGASILLTRTWFWQSETQLVMEEIITGHGKYRFATNLHLGDAPWERDGPCAFICPAQNSQVVMRFVPPRNSKIEVVPAKYSPEYGVEKAGRTIRVLGNVSLPINWSVQWEFCP